MDVLVRLNLCLSVSWLATEWVKPGRAPKHHTCRRGFVRTLGVRRGAVNALLSALDRVILRCESVDSDGADIRRLRNQTRLGLQFIDVSIFMF